MNESSRARGDPKELHVLGSLFTRQKTYNSRYSLVVSDPTTNLPLAGLTKGEQTGSRTLPQVWSYVVEGIVNGG
jgi:hypothetical protein